MTEKPPGTPGREFVTESLWAISNEGTIWQINPVNGDAAPVLHLDELTARERLSFQRYVMQGWEGKPRRASIPDEVDKILTETDLVHPERQ